MKIYPSFQKTAEIDLYRNPIPNLKSREAKFPGIVKLPSGELLALYEVGEAFDSLDSRMHISRSPDSGRTWSYQGPMFYESAAKRTDGTLKPQILPNGMLIAMGYRFDRDDAEMPICNPETGGLLPGSIITSFSADDGKSWSFPEQVEIGLDELVEVSGPPICLANGEFLAGGNVFERWDGSSSKGRRGVCIKSRDGGKSWDLISTFFSDENRVISPFETRFCRISTVKNEMILALVWAYNKDRNVHLPNHFTLSCDGGKNWTEPIDTGIRAQASNLLWLRDNLFISIHCHRADRRNGLWVRLLRLRNKGIDEDGNEFSLEVLEEEQIWGTSDVMNSKKKLAEQFGSLRFGQPSLLIVNSDKKEIEFLACHWCVERCVSGIKVHRVLLSL